MRAFDLLSRAEFEIRNSSQPRHHFEMTLVKWIHLRHLTPLSEMIMAGSGLRAQGSGKTGSGLTAQGSGKTRQEPAPASPPAASARPVPAPAPARQAPPPARSASPAPAAPVRNGAPGSDVDLKTAFLSSVREQNKTLHSMVIAQAQKIEVEGNAIVFTFAPVHKHLRGQFEGRRTWLEQLAQAIAGRRIAIVARESEAVAASAAPVEDPAALHRADLKARAEAEPAVQAVLDVFGGSVEDVEEI
jgi:hypothetical protein